MVLSKDMRRVKNARIELQESLALYTRMGDHKNLFATLQSASFLTGVPLDSVSSNKIKAAERQALSESVIVNGVKTVAASKKFGTLRLMKDLSYQLCQINELPLNPQDVYEAIIMRMSKTLASVDAYSKLKRIIRASNLSLVRDDATSKYTTTVEIYESGGCLHATISTPCVFGVVRNAELKPGKVDINNNGLLVNQQRGYHIEPWIRFDVMVVERINLSTKDGMRLARLL